MASVQGALLLKDASCQKMLGMYDANFALLSQGKAAVVAQINAARSYINAIPAFSPQSVINGAVSDVVNNYDNMIPNVSDYDALAGIINQCAGLADDDMLRTPTTLVRGIAGKIKDGAFATVGALTSGIPEFNLANQVQSLLDTIGTSKIDLGLSKLTKYLACLDQFCGYNVTSRTTALNDFCNSCYVNPSGQFKLQEFMDSTVAPATAKANMQTCINTYEDVKKTIDVRSGLALNNLKSQVPTPKSAASYILPTAVTRYIPF
jgi:hypothetical protein